MNKLQTIKQQLEKDEKKIITKAGKVIPYAITNMSEWIAFDNGEVPDYNAYVAHSIIFYIAPQIELLSNSHLIEKLIPPLYSPRLIVNLEDELNSFIESLVPNLQPDNKKLFEINFGQYLSHSELKFKEVILKETIGIRTFTTEDNYFKNKYGFSDGQLIVPSKEKEISRNITIKIYPHEDISRCVAVSNGDAKGMTKKEYEGVRHIKLGFFDDRKINLRRGVALDDLIEFVQARSKVHDPTEIQLKHYYGSSI